MKYMLAKFNELIRSDEGYQVDVVDPKDITYDNYNNYFQYYPVPVIGPDITDSICFALIAKHGYHTTKVISLYAHCSDARKAKYEIFNTDNPDHNRLISNVLGHDVVSAYVNKVIL